MFSTIFLIFITIFLIQNKRYRWFYILHKTIIRDLRAALKFVELNYKLWKYEKNKITVPKLFIQNVRKHPNKVAFYFEEEAWTFEDIDIFSNRVANYFKTQGFKKHDTVALLLESRPEYVCIWLGLAKIGVITALINTNLVSDPLVHSLNISKSKALIYGSDFAKSIIDISSKISNMKLYQFNNQAEKQEISNNSHDLKSDLLKTDIISPISEIELGNPKDKIIYIYTSGTTGLPKAAVITNSRYMFMALGLNLMMCLRNDDIIYNPLPLYHSAGAIAGVGQCLLLGVTVAIRKKFSASNFWSDCIKYKCTAAQYIGEICRYILFAHIKDTEPINHSVRLIFGNGLRPQIWSQFVKKFNIKHVYEFYGATEGNSNLINTDNTIGAVGFVPRYARIIYPVILIKFDENSGEPMRNKDNFCIPCQPGEPGIIVGVINPKKAQNQFSGYADEKATQKKVIRNVFKKGDLYFNSGDILVQDELGYYYFKDRTGDTFRWKGENVATHEIEAVISNIADFNDAIVYGVEVPGLEGRAGMVAIVDTNKSVNLEELCKGFKSNLPSYAVPIFIRIMKSAPLTGTFKLKKGDLQKDGFDVNKIEDSLYFYDSKKSNYVQLTKDIYNDIVDGKIRL